MASAALDNPVLKTYLSEVDAIIEGTGFFEMEGANVRFVQTYICPARVW